MAKKHPIKDLLIKLGISTPHSFAQFFPRVRDRRDISVLRCKESGVIILSNIDHVTLRHYESKKFNGLGAKNRKDALQATMVDSERRYNQFSNLIVGKKWIDIGAGAGGVLDALSPLAGSITAVEPQEESRLSLVEAGYRAFPTFDSVPDSHFDIATLFHVLEHLPDPLETLRSIRKRLVKGGKIIVEVPHANDFLISFLDHDSFKKHTFWSEHLILHTRESLRRLLEAAGFSAITIKGFQRYPLSNHLYWLTRNKPGGHIHWAFLDDPLLITAYADMLAKLDKTDTIIAVAEN